MNQVVINDPRLQRRNFYIILTLAILAIPAGFIGWFLIWYQTGNGQILGAAAAEERNLAISKAYNLYEEYKNSGTNFKSGPCLTNNLIEGWALDIVHDPKIAVDNEPQNQCSDYLYGRVGHIVELDINGRLIKAE